ncbi:MAG TPA: hypothetical protein VFK27_01455, partial [Bacillales bacterium]|nr:hypothetical protein [Bacillales bacterium]
MGKSRKIVSIALGACITASLAGVHTASADTGSELHEQQIHIKQSQSKLNHVQQEKEQAIKELKQLQDQITEAQNKLNEKVRERKETQQEIQDLKKKIFETQ